MLSRLLVLRDGLVVRHDAAVVAHRRQQHLATVDVHADRAHRRRRAVGILHPRPVREIDVALLEQARRIRLAEGRLHLGLRGLLLWASARSCSRCAGRRRGPGAAAGVKFLLIAS
jgi:hypothetical protein